MPSVADGPAWERLIASGKRSKNATASTAPALNANIRWSRSRRRNASSPPAIVARNVAKATVRTKETCICWPKNYRRVVILFRVAALSALAGDASVIFSCRKWLIRLLLAHDQSRKKGKDHGQHHKRCRLQRGRSRRFSGDARRGPL